MHGDLKGADTERQALPGGSRSVLAAIDRSERARAALLLAAGIARNQDAELVVVHVPTGGLLAGWAVSYGAAAELRRARREVAEALMEAVRPALELEGVRWRLVVAEGPIAPALRHLAEQVRAGTVVVGAPRATWLARLYHRLVPSIPLQLLRRDHHFTLLVA